MAAERTVTVSGNRAEVLAFVAAHLERLDEVADRTQTGRPADERLPLERLQHLEGLVRVLRTGVQHDPGHLPSPHYLRAVAGQAIAWLESEYKLGRVSW